ncbi:hypothetical protein Vadar_012748 [Vaccinium darrowii]|uniref:Uncharacterized protein n=1 Tax=Vaccinium darrowii TaxID=229202 RepID=A0ACB7X0C9_9ERIC|nr:hypothetical protein Vadar_012748 [Vaccinium darrowii]
MAISTRLGRRQQRNGFWGQRQHQYLSLRAFTTRKGIRILLISLAVVAILPPIFFHFKLRRFHQIQLRKCGWLNNPPLVCAHGGDASKAFPNTMTAYRAALHSQVDCIEIDVSRSSDGVLFALHDRDLQRISGNSTSKVGYLSMKQIKELDVSNQVSLEFNDESIPTVEDALKFVSSAVKQVILDAKVGPPSYDKGLAKDIMAVVERTKCKNCLVWAKSDNLARDVIKLSPETTVGYIVMKDPSTGARSNLLRMRGQKPDIVSGNLLIKFGFKIVLIGKLLRLKERFTLRKESVWVVSVLDITEVNVVSCMVHSFL